MLGLQKRPKVPSGIFGQSAKRERLACLFAVAVGAPRLNHTHVPQPRRRGSLERLPVGIRNALRFRPAVGFGMEVHPAFFRWFVLFNPNAMALREEVLPDAGHLPRDLDMRAIRLDRELVLVA